MARKLPSTRSLSKRQRFEKEEELAREREGRFGKPLVLGEETPKERRERVIQASQFGPAKRGVRVKKKK